MNIVTPYNAPLYKLLIQLAILYVQFSNKNHGNAAVDARKSFPDHNYLIITISHTLNG